MEAQFLISNVMLVDPKSGNATRSSKKKEIEWESN
jgi:ribosomal protein L24